MHRAKVFLTVCAGLFLLALSYHLGARSAVAQAPGNPVAAAVGSATSHTVVFTAGGDVYQSVNPSDALNPWTWRGNVFGSGPTPVQRESFGAMKSRYRGERRAVRER